MMADFYDISLKCKENLDSIVENSVDEISTWFNSEFRKFEPSNPDYKLYTKSLSCANDLFVKNLKDYHNWLLENFIVSPKNQ